MTKRQQRKAAARAAKKPFMPIINEMHPHGNRLRRHAAAAGKNPHTTKGVVGWRVAAQRRGNSHGKPRYLGVVDRTACMYYDSHKIPRRIAV
jgi:hypothetical protein